MLLGAGAGRVLREPAGGAGARGGERGVPAAAGDGEGGGAGAAVGVRGRALAGGAAERGRADAEGPAFASGVAPAEIVAVSSGEVRAAWKEGDCPLLKMDTRGQRDRSIGTCAVWGERV